MYNGRSPLTRVNNDSRSSLYGNGSNSGRRDQRNQEPPSLDDVSERDENEYEEARDGSDGEETGKIVEPPRDEDPYIRALRYRFPNRSKKDYVYTRPNIASGLLFTKDRDFLLIDLYERCFRIVTTTIGAANERFQWKATVRNL